MTSRYTETCSIRDVVEVAAPVEGGLEFPSGKGKGRWNSLTRADVDGEKPRHPSFRGHSYSKDITVAIKYFDA